MRARAALIAALLGCATALASDPALESRAHEITRELRCLVCQNQTIADSNADLAVDLRRQVHEMLERGDSDAQIRSYMTERYGNFVLYRPPITAATVLLWVGPGLLLVAGLWTLWWTLRRRSRLSDDRFEPDHDRAPEDEGLNP